MAINTFSGSDTAASSNGQYLLYQNLISAGWTSVGEGNGVSGGMGVTGIVTNINYVWSVLQHPSSNRQVIITTESGGGIGYSYDGSLTGGSASNHPTTGNYAVSGYGVFDSGGGQTHVGIVQDTEPYCFHLQTRGESFGNITFQGSISFVYLDHIQSHDVDPYLVTIGSGTYTTGGWEFLNNFGVCLKPGSTTEYINTNAQLMGPFQAASIPMWPGYANTNSDGYYVDAPILWAKASFSDPFVADGYKGISETVFRSCGVILPADKAVTQQASFNNQTWLYCGHGMMIPWDGGTVYDPP